MIRRALEAFGDIVFTTDSAGVFTFVNQRFTDVYGYAPDDVVGKATPRILKSGKHDADVYVTLWGNLLADRAHRATMVNRTSAGRLVTVECVVSPLHEASGYCAIQRDVSGVRAQRRRGDLALAAVDHAPDAVVWFDEGGRILYANPEASLMSGYTPEQLLTLRISDLDTGKHGTWEDAWRRLESAGVEQLRTELRRRDGTVLPVEIRSTLIDDGEESFGCAIVRDVSERERLAFRLSQAEKMEAIGRLAGGVAHDFNNVLTAISGYASLLLTRAADPDTEADLQEILLGVDRASSLTSQLLAFGRNQPMSPVPLDLAEEVRNVHKLLARLVGEDVHVNLSFPEDRWLALADRTQVDQILLNLAANARDAMPDGGTLSITVANCSVSEEDLRRVAAPRAGEYVGITVRDTGIGIPEDLRPHVFEPFVTTKPLGKGTGLGLSTVYGILQQSGGFLVLDSTVGVGTAITAFFPRVVDDGRPAEPLGPCAGRPSEREGAGTVLIAEDDVSIREVAGRILRRAQYTVLLAQDPSDALRLAREHLGHIDLLLTDVLMPDMRGPDLAQAIRRLRPSIRLLFMSGYTDSEWSKPADAHFLQKPFDPAGLCQAVRVAIGGHASAPA